MDRAELERRGWITSSRDRLRVTHAVRPQWDLFPEDASALEEWKDAAVAQARREAMEEAAVVAENYGGGYERGAKIAAAIRRLAEEKADG